MLITNNAFRGCQGHLDVDTPIYGEIIFFLHIAPKTKPPSDSLIAFYHPFERLELFKSYYQTGHLRKYKICIIDISAIDEIVGAFPTDTRWWIHGKVPLPPSGRKDSNADESEGGDGEAEGNAENE